MKKLLFYILLFFTIFSCKKINSEKDFFGSWKRIEHSINGQSLSPNQLNVSYIINFQKEGNYSINAQILPWHCYPSSTGSDFGAWEYDKKKKELKLVTSKIDTVGVNGSFLKNHLISKIESEKESKLIMSFEDQCGQSVRIVFEKI
jgi:hypothetical protein